MADLRNSVLAYAKGFDAATLTPSQAELVVGLCAQIEASVSSVKALAAARAAEADAWRRRGFRSAAEALADQAGMSPSAARRALDTGRRLAGQPEVAAAALAGELSPEQAEAVADGVAADPTKAAELIDKAKNSSMPELNNEVAATKAAVTDPEERRRRVHARRSLRRWADREGALQGHLYGHPEDGAALWRVLDPIRRRLIVLRRGQVPNETLDALDYDALMAVAAIAGGADGEVGMADLLELGLFPQLERSPDWHPAFDPSPTDPPAAPSYPDNGGSGDRFSIVGTVPPLDPDPETHGSGDRPGSGLIDPVPDGREDGDSRRATVLAGADPSGAGGSGLAGRSDRPTRPERDARPPSQVPPDQPRGPDTPPAGHPAPDQPPGPDTPPAGDPAPDQPPARRAKKLAGSPLRLMIRVDLDTLLRGVPIDGELCELAGFGPIPVSVVENLAAQGNVFVVGLLTKARQLVGVYHHGRRPNAHQRSALDFLHPTCAVAGCNARAGLQYDHREDFAKTHFTVFDLLDRLCGHHHALKTQKNWALVEGVGKRAFVPPDDPRHPGHRAPRSAANP